MLGNWIKQTSTTTGTGALTLAPVSGFPGFSSQFAESERFCYAIIDDSTGGPIERGIGYLDGSGNLVRERPMATFVSGTYTGANASAVDLPAGTKRVVCTEGAQTALTTNQNLWSGATNTGYGDALLIVGAAGTLAMTADRALAIPFVAAADADITSVKFSVTTAGGAGTEARIAIYTVGPDGLPGVKLAESSPVLVDSTGVKTATITRMRPPPRFFVCIVTNGAPTLRSFVGGIAMWNAMGFDSVLVPIAYIHHVGATGLAFPATWTPVINLANVARPVLVCMTA